MQQLLLFNASQASSGLAGSVNANAGFDTDSAVGAGSEGFAGVMRAALLPEDGNAQPSLPSEAAYASDTLINDPSTLMTESLSGQSAAALTSFNGQGLPVLPNDSHVTQLTGLNKGPLTAQPMLTSDDVTSGLLSDHAYDLASDSGAIASVLMGPDGKPLPSGAEGSVSEGTESAPPSASVLGPQANAAVAAESLVSVLEGKPLSGNPKNASSEQGGLLQASLSAASTASTPAAAPLVSTQLPAQERTLLRPENVGGFSRSKGQGSSASVGGAPLTSSRPVAPDGPLTAAQPGIPEVASDSQRPLSAQWSSYLQGGGAQAQPSAKSDINFKMSMEQALSGIDVDAGGDVPDELLAKLTEASAPRSSEMGQRITAATADKPYSSSVNVPVADPEWGAKMNEKVMWMSSRGIQSAQIHLNPAELGPVDVKVSVQNDQTVISFNVQNAGVKELLESNVHRLREMIDQNGGSLAEVNVEDQSSNREGLAQQQNSQQGGSDSAGAQDETVANGEELSLSGVSDIGDMSLVDDYA